MVKFEIIRGKISWLDIKIKNKLKQWKIIYFLKVWNTFEGKRHHCF